MTLEALNLTLKKAKLYILAFLWAASVSAGAWVAWNLATGLEAKKQKKALEDEIKAHNKTATELRTVRENISKETAEAEKEIIYLPGVTIRENTENCDANASVVNYIKLRRAIQNKL